MLLKITDESLTGDILNSIEIKIKNEIVTVKEIIAARVKTEDKGYNRKVPQYFTGFIRP